MLLVVIGIMLVIVGIAMAAFRTAESGRLSQPRRRGTSSRPDTLEPGGKGRRLSLKADLPALGVAAVGAVLIFAGSAF